MKRAAFVIVAVLATSLATACAPTSAPPSAPALTLRVGTLQTDDLLPLWVAESKGWLTDAGLDVRITTFLSAQEQTAAVTAGQIDAIMTDMVVGAQLTASGVPMVFVTQMQGAPAGVVAGPGTGITRPADLAGVETGCASPTILEYIYDRALHDAGVPDGQIKTTEIKKLPVRLQMLLSGQIKAAVLPWTLYHLALAQGAAPVLGPGQVGGYTSTVLAFRSGWLAQTGSTDFVVNLLGAWNRAVDVVNADPDGQRALLAGKANLPSPLDTTYPVRHYPQTGAPPTAQVDDVLTWMRAKGYLTGDLTSDDLLSWKQQ